jgi:hypothetical protein
MTIFGTILISLIAVLIAAITSYNVFENDHISSTFGKMLTSLFMSIGFEIVFAMLFVCVFALSYKDDITNRMVIEESLQTVKIHSVSLDDQKPFALGIGYNDNGESVYRWFEEVKPNEYTCNEVKAKHFTVVKTDSVSPRMEYYKETKVTPKHCTWLFKDTMTRYWKPDEIGKIYIPKNSELRLHFLLNE